MIVTADTRQMQQLSRDLRKTDPDLQKEIQKGLKGAATTVAVEARLIAGFWSSRIPASIRTSARGFTVGVRAGGASAPHAKPYEGPKPFRHPVFSSDRSRWAKKPTPARPYLMPAAGQKSAEVGRAMQAAVDSAFQRNGFR